MNYFKEISKGEYDSRDFSNKLINVLAPNHYYSFNLADRTYFFDSNGSMDRVEIKICEKKDRIILLTEQRLYAFSISTGGITLLVRLWAPDINLFFVKDFLIVITEREVYKIDAVNSVIHSINYLSDTFIDYVLHDDKLAVNCFDGSVISIII